MLDVSRSTLREGLHLLEEERVVRTEHGSGRYLVSSPRDIKIDLAHLQSVTEMLATYGLEGRTEVLSCEEKAANEELSDLMDLDEGTFVLSIERLRYVKDVPIIYSIDVIPSSKLNGKWKNDDFEGSLLSVLEERYNIYLDYSRATINAITAAELIEKSVPLDSSVSWILLEQVNYNELGEAVIYSRDYYRSDYITFHVRRYR